MSKEYRLPRQFTEKWLKALRSGNYDQGVETLYSKMDDNYCCLGVAGRVCGIDDFDLKGHGYIHLPSTSGYQSEEDEEAALSLGKIALAVGYPKELFYEDPEQGLNHTLAFKLGELNDGGDSFEDIATWIEENVELYD